jgi:hypothetical protein
MKEMETEWKGQDENGKGNKNHWIVYARRIRKQGRAAGKCGVE